MPEQRSQSNNVVLVGEEELLCACMPKQMRVDLDACDR
jgi:hypothetical protein